MVLTSSGRSEGVSVVVAGRREPEGSDQGGTGGTRELPELPRRSLLMGKSGSRSPRVPEVDQQDDEERRAYDIYVEHHSYVTRIVVTCAHHLADVDRGSAQEPDGGCDHGRNPEVAPDPVRQNPQGADSEIRYSHLGLERVTRGPADGSRDLVGGEQVPRESVEPPNPMFITRSQIRRISATRPPVRGCSSR